MRYGICYVPNVITDLNGSNMKKYNHMDTIWSIYLWELFWCSNLEMYLNYLLFDRISSLHVYARPFTRVVRYICIYKIYYLSII